MSFYGWYMHTQYTPFTLMPVGAAEKFLTNLFLLCMNFMFFMCLTKQFLKVSCQAWNCWNSKSALVVKVKMESGHRTCFHPGGFQLGWKPSLQPAPENFAAQLSSEGQWTEFFFLSLKKSWCFCIHYQALWIFVSQCKCKRCQWNGQLGLKEESQH